MIEVFFAKTLNGYWVNTANYVREKAPSQMFDRAKNAPI